MAEVNPIALQKALSGMDYPAKKNDLVEQARANKADDALVNRLSHLKEQRFDGPDKVSKAIFRGR
ncbi:DUF2795 domain-containing protein [Streptomyces hoynatensis]|uniref:DUF2795 domain-containing protein n=1 Tax=Streptomyces hoynatensis TaxID=1141874 RepID=A0A3A9Z657_9ACTN|nr:DUF2795 domain-containing protein [Streptomyces hoynatensis]RKN43962.1 DUF2795 domain-containing protein [Streptomyces hoynatensis]